MSIIVNGSQLKDARIKAKLTQQQLSEQSGVPRGTISRLESTGGKITSADDLMSLNMALDIPLNKNHQNTSSETSHNIVSEDLTTYKSDITPIPFDDYMMVEYEDLATAAGYLGIEDINMLPETKRRLVPKEFDHGKYLVVKVDGHSMDNGTSISIPDGTEILIKELTLNAGEKLPIRNNLFVIVSKDGIVLKQIVEHNLEEGYLLCRSYNPKYKDYKIPLNDILQIFVYRKIVSFRPPIPDINLN